MDLGVAGHDGLFNLPLAKPLRKIDFDGRKGYVRAAIEAGVLIVPSVSIGGQETQLFLVRGDEIAKWLGLKRLWMEILPSGRGFPFALTSTIPANFPVSTRSTPTCLAVMQ